MPGGCRGRRSGIALPGAIAIPAVFLGLAAVLLVGPWPRRIPIDPPREIPAWAVDPTPVRSPVLRPEIVQGAYTFRCNDCHSLIASPAETERPLTQHRHIRLEHGINDRCFNCHHRGDRNSFVDYKGGAIPYDRPELVCAKCHGPVYRDWTHGVHGRTNGYWSARLGPSERRKCDECHDPHSPSFKPLKPAPPPATLRMGPGEETEGPREGARNPLLIYRKPRGAPEPER